MVHIVAVAVAAGGAVAVEANALVAHSRSPHADGAAVGAAPAKPLHIPHEQCGEGGFGAACGRCKDPGRPLGLLGTFS